MDRIKMAVATAERKKSKGFASEAFHYIFLEVVFPTLQSALRIRTPFRQGVFILLLLTCYSTQKETHKRNPMCLECK